MKILSLSIVTFCLILFSSCVHKQDYTKYIEETNRYYDSFKGKPLSYAIQKWGIPTKEYKANGKTYLEWTKEVEVSENSSWSKRVPIGVSPQDNVWNPAVRYQYFCISGRSITVEKGKIITVNGR